MDIVKRYNNNKMKKYYLLILGAILSAHLYAIGSTDSLRLIPQPVDISFQKGTFQLPEEVSIHFPKQLQQEAAFLEGYLKESNINVKSHIQLSSATICLILSDKILPEQKEGYILEISDKQIHLKANSSTGIFYGIQTFKQIITEYIHQPIPRMTITDFPTFSWRAFMLDEGRYFKGKKVVCQLLDQMASLKMNTFHWHLTDDQGWRIEIKQYPKLTEIGSCRETSETGHFESNQFDGKTHCGFYTQDEIKEVIEYGRKRHILIIPEIEMPGHASAAIASYPWLGTVQESIKVPGRFGVHYNAFNVADTKVLNALKDILTEVIRLFPSSVIHIGGDEVKYNQWKSSEYIQRYMKKHSLQTPAELQVHFTNGISNWLSSQGKRMMGWNEITGMKLHEYQSSTDTAIQNEKLAQNAIVHIWKGDTILIKETIEKGYDIVNAYHDYTYLDYSEEKIPMEKAYHFNPIPHGVTKQQEAHVLGISCQMWGEFIPTVESMNKKIFPRIAAYAENGWCQPKNKNYSLFMKALQKNNGLLKAVH